jgi:hypothetical protein
LSGSWLSLKALLERSELERAILKAADLLEKGDYDPVEKADQGCGADQFDQGHGHRLLGRSC